MIRPAHPVLTEADSRPLDLPLGFRGELWFDEGNMRPTTNQLEEIGG